MARSLIDVDNPNIEVRVTLTFSARLSFNYSEHGDYFHSEFAWPRF